MTSRAAPPARRGLPRRTEARAKRTLAVARFLYPLAGVWGGFSPRTPAFPARDGVWGNAPRFFCPPLLSVRLAPARRPGSIRACIGPCAFGAFIFW